MNHKTIKFASRHFAIFALLISALFVFSCSDDDEEPSFEPDSYIKANINGTEYTFAGGAIFEPKTLLDTTVFREDTTYLAGFAGNCSTSNTNAVEIGSNIEFFVPSLSADTIGLDDFDITLRIDSKEYAPLATQHDSTFQVIIGVVGGVGTEKLTGSFSGLIYTEEDTITISGGQLSLDYLENNSSKFDIVDEKWNCN